MVSTTYSKEQRALICAVFRQARLTIWDGHGECHDGITICYYIRRSRGRVWARREAQRIVMRRLNPYMTVYSYLLCGVRVPHHRLTQKGVQEFRMRWLDELIREFSD